jgi:hypothetical protein
MSVYINAFPIVKYPDKIQILRVAYSEDTYKICKNFSYRIGSSLYIYDSKAGIEEKFILTKNSTEFSLLFQHLVLRSIKDACSEKKYKTGEWDRRLTIIRNEPSTKTDYVEIYEGIEIQTIHWQDISFAIVVDYLTRNDFTEKFRAEKLSGNDSLPVPSYSNFYKYLGSEEAKNIMTKIGDLRGEKIKGRMRSDALKQRMSKIKEFLMDCLDWKEETEKELLLPIRESILVSSKNVEVVLLSGNERAYE